MTNDSEQLKRWREELTPGIPVSPHVPSARLRIPSRPLLALVLAGALVGVGASPHLTLPAPPRMELSIEAPPHMEPTPWRVAWNLSETDELSNAFDWIQRAAFGVDTGPLRSLLPVPTPDVFQIKLRISGDATLAENRWFVQRNSGRLEARSKPWPVWVKAPLHAAIVVSPFQVMGQAYENGFVQLRTKPKLWNKYYHKGQTEVTAGREWGPLFVTEGSAEAYELYVLFAKHEKDLPVGLPDSDIASLPVDTGRLDVVGPIDFFLEGLRGPIPTDEEIRREQVLVDKVAARFTEPDQDQAAAAPPQVTYRFTCAGSVSAGTKELDLQYVLGVLAGHHLWMQSEPWTIKPNSCDRDRCRFEDKKVTFGVRPDEPSPQEPRLYLELWLIAITPDFEGQLAEEQAWEATALPKGCVRVASVTVEKIPHDEQ